MLLLAAAPAQSAAPLETLPDEEEIAAHRSFDPEPSLQRTSGGALIVNAFILTGPVRVAVHDRRTDALILERSSDSLFPFELSHHELGIEPEQARVRIYVDGNLAHTLELEP